MAKPSQKDEAATEADQSSMNSSLINPSSIGILLLWAALLAYAVLLSPNQTPYRDQIFIKLLVGITKDDTFSVNQVFFSVFNVIGIYTFFLQCLLIPGGRSGNKIPAWPFVVVGYFLGSFALLPYFALWRPDPDLKLPPKEEELEGLSKLAMRGAETTILPLGALAASIYLVYNAATADSQAWTSFLGLFDESRLVHVSTIDLMVLAALTPFWMSNDAQLRGWKYRETLVPILSLLPAIGPALYLVLRPKTGDEPEQN